MAINNGRMLNEPYARARSPAHREHAKRQYRTSITRDRRSLRKRADTEFRTALRLQNVFFVSLFLLFLLALLPKAQQTIIIYSGVE